MSSNVLSFLISPGFRSAAYLGNALWHTSAAVHFGLFPEFMMKKLSTRKSDVKTIETPEGDSHHHDLMRYLGAINVGYALLAGIQLTPLVLRRLSGSSTKDQFRTNVKAPAAVKYDSGAFDVVAFSVLGAANLSQALLNWFWARPSDRWIIGHLIDGKPDRITVLDTLFSVIDFAIVAARLAGY